MKQFLLWLLFVTIMSTLLIVGNVYTLPSLAMTATFILWVQSIASIFALIMVHIPDVDLMPIQKYIKANPMGRYLDVVGKIIFISILAYFTYPLLAIVLIGILLTNQLVINKALNVPTEK